jgi:hypothetical protein
MPRIVSMIIWCGLVLIGLIVLLPGSYRTIKSGPVATRLLPRNTLLLPSETENPGFTYRYIVAKDGVKKGEALRPEDVADQPVLLEAPPAKLLLLLPLPRASVAGGFNAGSKVRLCGKAAVAFGEVTIQAVRCDADASCAAAIELPVSAAGDVVAKGLKDQTSTSELRLSTTCD